MAKQIVKKIDNQENDLITARVLTEKRLLKLMDKEENLMEEINSAKLSLELIIAKMDELGISADKAE
jgi:hypothetical protein